MMKRLTFFILILGASTVAFAQDDLMDILDDGKGSEKVPNSFKASRLINAHTPETMGKGDLDFRVDHRFDNASLGHDFLWGFDNVLDMRLAFEYGLTDKITLGFGRSKGNYLDGFVKYKVLHQTTDNKVPVTLSWFSSTGVIPHGTTVEFPKLSHRFTYVHQALVSRRFNSNLSIELMPTVVHQNIAAANDQNTIFALGAGLRYMFSRSSGVILDIYKPFSDIRTSDNGYFPPIGIGYEIETGGHVFHLTLTNAVFLTETRYITDSPDDWQEGDFKFGFNISRIF